MKPLIALGLLAAGALTLGSCEALGTSDACALNEDDSVVLVGGNDINIRVVSTRLINGVRTFTFNTPGLIEGLCVAAPEKDNKVTFRVTPSAGTTGLLATGNVQPAIGFQPYSFGLSYNNGSSILEVEIKNIGLRQGSKDGKSGYADITLDLSFPTQGSEAADHVWLQGHVAKIEVIWHFQLVGEQD